MDTCIPSNLKLVIFDLDNTLLLKHERKMGIKAKDIVDFFYRHGLKVCMASLNQMAKIILQLNDIDHLFEHVEQREQDSTNYFKHNMFINIINKTRTNPKNILLFDDCFFHTQEAKALGIKSILVERDNGITLNNVKAGIRMFKERTKRRSSY